MEPVPRLEGAGGQGADAPASERKGHKKNRMAMQLPGTTTAGNKSRGNTRRGGRAGSELVYRHNSVVEALQGGVPVSALHVQQFRVCGGRLCQTIPNRTQAP